MGNRAGLNAVVNRKYHRELNPGHPARSLVSTLTELLLHCEYLHELDDTYTNMWEPG